MHKPQKLFPARAGVILNLTVNYAFNAAFPRTRGGDPLIAAGAQNGLDFSPHARG